MSVEKRALEKTNDCQQAIQAVRHVLCLRFSAVAFGGVLSPDTQRHPRWICFSNMKNNDGH